MPHWEGWRWPAAQCAVVSKGSTFAFHGPQVWVLDVREPSGEGLPPAGMASPSLRPSEPSPSAVSCACPEASRGRGHGSGPNLAPLL